MLNKATNNNNKKKLIIIGGAVIGVILIGFFVFFLLSGDGKEKNLKDFYAKIFHLDTNIQQIQTK